MHGRMGKPECGSENQSMWLMSCILALMAQRYSSSSCASSPGAWATLRSLTSRCLARPSNSSAFSISARQSDPSFSLSICRSSRVLREGMRPSNFSRSSLRQSGWRAGAFSSGSSSLLTSPRSILARMYCLKRRWYFCPSLRGSASGSDRGWAWEEMVEQWSEQATRLGVRCLRGLCCCWALSICSICLRLLGSMVGLKWCLTSRLQACLRARMAWRSSSCWRFLASASTISCSTRYLNFPLQIFSSNCFWRSCSFWRASSSSAFLRSRSSWRSSWQRSSCISSSSTLRGSQRACLSLRAWQRSLRSSFWRCSNSSSFFWQSGFSCLQSLRNCRQLSSSERAFSASSFRVCCLAANSRASLSWRYCFACCSRCSSSCLSSSSSARLRSRSSSSLVLFSSRSRCFSRTNYSAMRVLTPSGSKSSRPGRATGWSSWNSTESYPILSCSSVSRCLMSLSISCLRWRSGSGFCVRGAYLGPVEDGHVCGLYVDCDLVDDGVEGELQALLEVVAGREAGASGLQQVLLLVTGHLADVHLLLPRAPRCLHLNRTLPTFSRSSAPVPLALRDNSPSSSAVAAADSPAFSPNCIFPTMESPRRIGLRGRGGSRVWWASGRLGGCGRASLEAAWWSERSSSSEESSSKRAGWLLLGACSWSSLFKKSNIYKAGGCWGAGIILIDRFESMNNYQQPLDDASSDSSDPTVRITQRPANNTHRPRPPQPPRPQHRPSSPKKPKPKAKGKPELKAKPKKGREKEKRRSASDYLILGESYVSAGVAREATRRLAEQQRATGRVMRVERLQRKEQRCVRRVEAYIQTFVQGLRVSRAIRSLPASQKAALCALLREREEESLEEYFRLAMEALEGQAVRYQQSFPHKHRAISRWKNSRLHQLSSAQSFLAQPATDLTHDLTAELALLDAQQFFPELKTEAEQLRRTLSEHLREQERLKEEREEGENEQSEERQDGGVQWVLGRLLEFIMEREQVAEELLARLQEGVEPLLGDQLFVSFEREVIGASEDAAEQREQRYIHMFNKAVFDLVNQAAPALLPRCPHHALDQLLPWLFEQAPAHRREEVEDPHCLIAVGEAVLECLLEDALWDFLQHL